MDASTSNTDTLVRYLDSSPSPFHAVSNAIALLSEAGFAELAMGADWTDLPASGFVARDGALIAWKTAPGVGPNAPFRIAGAHTDSPCLRVKPRPDSGSFGWRQLGVEVYGGILNNSWLDRDLGIAGRLALGDGTSALVDVRRGVARVPQLAVHLDRGVNDALTLDKQKHLRPVWGLGTPTAGEFAEWISNEAGVPRATWWDLCLYDVQGAAVLGVDHSLLASGRLDNLLSCWAAVASLLSSTPTEHVSMIVLNDHEEVGSSSTTGASGPFLEQVLQRHVAARGGSHDDLLRAFGESACVSADNAHAIHPNYPERHDADHLPLVNAGPAIKVNVNQRYATSSRTAALFQRACETAGVPWQVFSSNNSMPCGSTIGPLTATRLGIDTVDVGVPQLSMHSAREVCGVADPAHLASALSAYFSGSD